MQCPMDWPYFEHWTILNLLCACFNISKLLFEGEDLTKGKDGGVQRSMLTKGQGYQSPNKWATVHGKSQLAAVLYRSCPLTVSVESHYRPRDVEL